MTKFKTRLFAVLSVVWSVFIFSNSIKTGVESSKASDGIVSKLVSALHLTIDVDLLTMIIRKLAHLTEFFILGLFISLSYYYLITKFKQYSGTILFIGLSAGVIDEFLQSFTLGRSSEVRDVIIDFCGIFIGFIIVYIVDKVKRRNITKLIENGID